MAEAARMTATEARSQFAETVSRVAYGGHSVVIERRGRPLAALISHEQFELFQRFLAAAEDAIDTADLVATADDELVDLDTAMAELD